MNAEKILYKIHVRGRVQGVGFRWISSREADKIGISGYVKNLSDGRVYIEAEGTREQLEYFLEWCRNSPGMSVVESVEKECFPSAGYRDFRIEY